MATSLPIPELEDSPMPDAPSSSPSRLNKGVLSPNVWPSSPKFRPFKPKPPHELKQPRPPEPSKVARKSGIVPPPQRTSQEAIALIAKMAQPNRTHVGPGGLPTPNDSFTAQRKSRERSAISKKAVTPRRSAPPQPPAARVSGTPTSVTQPSPSQRRSARDTPQKVPGFYDRSAFPWAARNVQSQEPRYPAASVRRSSQTGSQRSPDRIASRTAQSRASPPNSSQVQQKPALPSPLTVSKTVKSQPIESIEMSAATSPTIKPEDTLPQERLRAATIMAARKLVRQRFPVTSFTLREAQRKGVELETQMRARRSSGNPRTWDRIQAHKRKTTPSASSETGSCTVQYFSLETGESRSSQTVLNSVREYEGDEAPPFAPVVMPAQTNFLTPEDEHIKYIPYDTNDNIEEYLRNIPRAVEGATFESDTNNIAAERAHYFHELAVQLLSEGKIAPLDILNFLLKKLKIWDEINPEVQSYFTPDEKSEDFFPAGFKMKDSEYMMLESSLSTKRLRAPERAVERTCDALYVATHCSSWALFGFTNECESSLKTAEDFMLSRAERRHRTSPPEKIPESTTYLKLSCLICGVHDCPTHGDWDGPETRNMIVYGETRLSHTIAQVRDLLDRANVQPLHRPPRTPDQIPCSELCYLYADVETTENPGSWGDEPLSVISRSGAAGGVFYGQEACILAPAIDKNCIDVFRALQTIHRAKIGDLPEGLNSSPLCSPSSSPRQSRHAMNLNARRQKASQGQEVDNDDQVDQPASHAMLVPCGHEGPCVPENENCCCIDKIKPSNSGCGKFCQCPPDCKLRQVGCKCAANGKTCSTAQCICWREWRECDPDLCGTCGVFDLVFPEEATMPGVQPGKLCLNAGLTVGKSKKLYLGESEIPGAGYGLFVGEPITAGHYIGEYVGEVLSHDETERRGELYDYRGCSYHFNLNTHQAIDATVHGSLLRYINHGTGSIQNCSPRVVLVQSVHRIAFIANRNLKTGEELFFDYGYSKEGIRDVTGLPRWAMAEKEMERKSRKERLKRLDNEAGDRRRLSSRESSSGASNRSGQAKPKNRGRSARTEIMELSD